MAIDQVHDLQQVYRKILNSISRPGVIANLHDQASGIDYQLPCYDATLLTTMMLFDGEVTFHVISEHKRSIQEKISAYTLATYAPLHEADYIIVLEDAKESSIIQALDQCKKGNLINPQDSSTLIFESKTALSNEVQLLLTGPGISYQNHLQTSFTKSVWLARNECIKEYPLGVDVVLTDAKLQVACIPRTTKVALLEVE
ncbi:phosphonate C-P lyase system protein PhnH [Virgibacillus proomii]|jgi:alpha-D-ribose 1-methylphosphonate 5-triphosphate synthase subunit PhnH|uniref:phosphonate C-P lyase system protein PhnH n=1 Tax=Virgibacillus proomii TaxID=84407 RepID=UPI000985BF0B|nr:phosphonate C-P lyase system protein PhnH [Virgibacillus proomii]